MNTLADIDDFELNLFYDQSANVVTSDKIWPFLSTEMIKSGGGSD